MRRVMPSIPFAQAQQPVKQKQDTNVNCGSNQARNGRYELRHSTASAPSGASWAAGVSVSPGEAGALLRAPGGGRGGNIRREDEYAPALAFCQNPWYPDSRKEPSFSAAIDGGRLALSTGGTFLPPDLLKGGCPMVTYSELFAYSLVIIGICGLFIQAHKKK